MAAQGACGLNPGLLPPKLGLSFRVKGHGDAFLRLPHHLARFGGHHIDHAPCR
jgi:hypothetical protein